MTLFGPKRAFGAGERREQNAVIKVYSANELKVALTKVYQLPNGVGTIQIAGDITITEPIKLQIESGPAKPREIIIQSIGGARIFNGNKKDNAYNYDIAGNTNLPVFDFGKITYFTQPIKYTFKDLVINNITSRPFGAFIGVDLGGRTSAPDPNLPLVSVNNVKLNNVWGFILPYDSVGTFSIAAHIESYTTRVDGLTIKNDDTSITYFYLNNKHLGFSYGNFTNISLVDYDDNFYTRNHLRIIPNRYFGNNTFQSIGPFINIQSPPSAYLAGNTLGTGNVISGAQILGTYANESFNYINCFFGVENPTIFITSNSTNGFNVVGLANQRDNSNVLLDTDFVTDTTFCRYTNGKGFPITVLSSLSSLQSPMNYEVNWHLAIRERATDKINTYHIKTNCKKIGTTFTVYSNTTVSASEEFFTMTGLVPTVGFDWIQIAPTAGPSNLLDVSCVIHIKGYKIPMTYF